MKQRVLLAFVAAALTAGLTVAPQAAEVKLKAASFQPEKVVFAKHFYRWVGETNRRCDGKVEISVIGPENIRSILQWDALKRGEVDMYFGPANYYRGVIPEADVLNLAHNEPAAQRRNGAWAVLNTFHNERMNAWYLTTLIAGIKFFVYTTKPANGGRFEGLHLRSVPLYDGFMRSLGARTRHMDTSELRGALERGEVHGYGWPLWGIDTYGWDKFTKYRYGPGFLNTAAPVLVNLDKWRSLADDQRRCLTDMATWVETEWPKWRAAEDRAQLARLEAAGVKYIDLGAAFGRKAEDIYWRMLRTAEPAYVSKMRPLLQAGD